jgi:hypothetical protein
LPRDPGGTGLLLSSGSGCLSFGKAERDLMSSDGMKKRRPVF